MLMYYVSLKPGYWKTFGTPFDAFWCCTGTGVEEYSKVNDSIYFHDTKNLYVNIFAGSEVQWPEKNVSLMQETNFPLEEATTLTIRAGSPTAFGLKVRIPYWATNGVTFRINGKPHPLEAKPESYATLHRTWHDGDKIEISMPMSLHVCPIPDAPDVQAVMYGPLVLAGEMGRDGLSDKVIYGDSGPFADKRDYPMPELLTASGQGNDAVHRLPGKELRFETVNQASVMHLKPLYQVMDQRYTVYWKVNQKTV